MLARGLGLLLIGSIPLIGCAGQNALRKSMDSWLGHPISEYALRFGPPTSSFDIGANQRAFQWQTTAQTAGIAVPINGTVVYRPPEQTSCRISFVASTSAKAPTLADWNIKQWSYQGDC